MYFRSYDFPYWLQCNHRLNKINWEQQEIKKKKKYKQSQQKTKPETNSLPVTSSNQCVDDNIMSELCSNLNIMQTSAAIQNEVFCAHVMITINISVHKTVQLPFCAQGSHQLCENHFQNQFPEVTVFIFCVRTLTSMCLLTTDTVFTSLFSCRSFMCICYLVSKHGQSVQCWQTDPTSN